mgnify:CR=1 FL=1
MREFGNHRAQRFDLASQLSIFGNQFLVVLLGLYELSAQRLDIWGNGSAPDGHLELVHQIAMMFVESLPWYPRFVSQRHHRACATAPLGLVISETVDRVLNLLAFLILACGRIPQDGHSSSSL